MKPDNFKEHLIALLKNSFKITKSAENGDIMIFISDYEETAEKLIKIFEKRII